MTADVSVTGYRALRLCSSGGGYEAIPTASAPLDLGRVRAALERAGVVVLDARVMLIATLPPETTISRSGRLLFKTADEAGARRAFDRLFELLGPELSAVGPRPSRPS